MIKKDTKFKSIVLDKVGTVLFILDHVTGRYEELGPIHDKLAECIKYMETEAVKRFGKDINKQFILELQFVQRPEPRFNHILFSLNRQILRHKGGRVIGNPYELRLPKNDPFVTPNTQWCKKI